MAAGRLAGRVALVTGASRGLGAAIARRYAAEGAELILLARTVGGLEEIDDAIRALGGHATLVPLDIADFPALDRLGAAIYERHKRLDILVANAAVLGTLSPLAHIDPKEWQRVIDVNLTANWRLIRSLDALLRASPAGRAIFVTASSGKAPRAYWGTYAVTKAALEQLAGIYAEEVETTKVRVNLVDPGRLRTAMRAQAYPGEKPEAQPLPETVTDIFVELAEASCRRHGERIEAQG
ncbi:MAG TPA: SDR family NAD(P)-dependent oxidoreductase [Dongiaceae bacterium]|nr:SDR family NAD(P)-dependent oxidoreductase [Dongiaceae bacterium]